MVFSAMLLIFKLSEIIVVKGWVTVFFQGVSQGLAQALSSPCFALAFFQQVVAEPAQTLLSVVCA